MSKALAITRRALLRQVDALGVDSFEFGVLNEQSRKMLRRQWTRKMLERSVGWLKSMNIRGCHIYLRPAGSVGILLLDDLSKGSLEKMESLGLPPICTVETSPLNYQAWVRLDVKASIDPELATAAGEILAKRLDADLNSKDWRHLGRAVGFTNIKPQYVNDLGHYPFVKLTSTGNESIENTAVLLAEARELLDEKLREAKALAEQLRNASNAQSPDADPTAFYDDCIQHMAKQFGPGMDKSRAEWAAAKRMRMAGFTFEQIADVMLSDPDICQRKRGHVEHYVVKMTLNKLFSQSNPPTN